MFNQGNCVVNYNFLDEKNRKKKVELHISCIQASILLLFNEHNTYKFDSLREALGANVDILKYTLSPLIYNKVRLLGVKGAKKKKKLLKKLMKKLMMKDQKKMVKWMIMKKKLTKKQ